MKKALMILLLLAMASVTMGSNCNTVVRDENVYRTELDFLEQTATQPAAALVGWFDLHCKCENGKFVGEHAAKCAKDAKLVQVIRVRVPYHKDMMLWNADLLKKRPPKDPPEVPPAEDLCPK
jgi:hypothetical protein